jgi:hypothetical protein
VQFLKQFSLTSTRTLFPAGALSVLRPVSSWWRQSRTAGSVRSTFDPQPTAVSRHRLLSRLRPDPSQWVLGAVVRAGVRVGRWRGRSVEPGVGPTAGSGLGGGWHRAAGTPTQAGVTGSIATW